MGACGVLLLLLLLLLFLVSYPPLLYSEEFYPVHCDGSPQCNEASLSVVQEVLADFPVLRKIAERVQGDADIGGSSVARKEIVEHVLQVANGTEQTYFKACQRVSAHAMRVKETPLSTSKRVNKCSRSFPQWPAREGSMWMFGGRDGRPILYNLDKRSVLMCHIAKVGSSRWKMLLHKAMGDPDYISQPPHMDAMVWLPQARLDRQPLSKPRTLSFIIVRNPYVRALSAFLDKIHLNPLPDPKKGPQPELYYGVHGPDHDKQPDQTFRVSFAEYIAFISGRGSFLLRDVHFRPVTEMCGDMRYDVVLRVEEMDDWYGELIRFLGVEAAARKGWTEPSKYNMNAKLPCFYPGPNQDCDFWSKKRDSVSGKMAANSDSAGTTSHDTHALEALHMHYTRDIARSVTNIYRKDFRVFQYPLWNGDIKTFKAITKDASLSDSSTSAAAGISGKKSDDDVVLPAGSDDVVPAWLQWPALQMFPGMTWGNEVEQRHPNAIAMLLGWEDVAAIDKAFVALMTNVKMHAQYGTNADIVVMLYGVPAEYNHRLDPAGLHHNILTTELGVRMLYIDMSLLLEAYQGRTKMEFKKLIMYGKWFILALTEYERVLFHDLDAHPLTNFNHYFDMPLGRSKGGLFMQGALTPANGGFFMVTPNQVLFRELITKSMHAIQAGNIGVEAQLTGKGWHDGKQMVVWQSEVGWGLPPAEAGWKYARKGKKWDFFAANYDQGLLWYLCLRLQRCFVVNLDCLKNEACWSVNQALRGMHEEANAVWDVANAKSRYLYFPSKEKTYCNAKMIRLETGLEWMVKPAEETNATSVARGSPNVQAFLNRPYVYDFAHYSGPGSKPWDVCSALGMPLTAMFRACPTTRVDMTTYCHHWREMAKAYCKLRGKQDASFECILGGVPATENGGNKKLMERWDWKEHEIDYEDHHELTDSNNQRQHPSAPRKVVVVEEEDEEEEKFLVHGAIAAVSIALVVACCCTPCCKKKFSIYSKRMFASPKLSR